MSRSVALAHIIRQDDGTSTGVWGVYRIQSAFQPIFAFRDGQLKIEAFEGLVRPSKDGAPVSPGQFFRAIPEQDRMEVETLTRTLHLLNAGVCLDSVAKIFVNFDPSVFTDPAASDVALREMRLTLHEAGIDRERIVCEVTEHDVSDEGALMAFVEALRRHGFAIAVDDYGADSSDMPRLRRIAPEIVKFDAQWITHLMDSAPGFELLRTMVETFKDWGITTLFEGIEEHWQLDLAAQCGVELVQGFVLARPEIAPTSFSVFSKLADNEQTQAKEQISEDTALPSEPGHRPIAAKPVETAGARRVAQRRVFGRRQSA